VLIGQAVGLVPAFLLLDALPHRRALLGVSASALVLTTVGILCVAVAAMLLRALGPVRNQGWRTAILVSACSTACAVGVVAAYLKLAPERDAGVAPPPWALFPLASALGSTLGLIAAGQREGGDVNSRERT